MSEHDTCACCTDTHLNQMVDFRKAYSRGQFHRINYYRPYRST